MVITKFCIDQIFDTASHFRIMNFVPKNKILAPKHRETGNAPREALAECRGVPPRCERDLGDPLSGL